MAGTRRRGANPQYRMQTTRNLLQPFLGNPAFELAARALAARQTLQPPVTLAGLTQTAKGLVVAGLAHTLNRPLVLLGAERESLETLRQTIAAVLGWLDPAALKTVFVLPSWDVTPYENRSPHAEVSERRAVTLVNIARGNARIVLAPSLAAWGRFRKAVDYRSLSLEIKRGDEIGLEDFAEHLAGAGYEPREPVDSAGFYSVRGGIVDVYPPETEWPLRIEFDGDQIESIREFDPATQRSRGQASTAFILPLSEHRQRSGSSLLRPTLGIAPEGGSPALEGRERDGGHDFSARYPGWEFFPSFTVGHPNSLFGLLEDPAIIWDEPADMMRHVAAAREAWCAAYDAVRDVSPAPPRPQDLLLDDEEFRQAVGSLPQLFLKELEVADAAGQETAGNGAVAFSMPSQPAPKFHGDIKSCLEDLEARRNRSERVIISLSSAGKVERFEEALRDSGIPFTVIPNAAASPSEGDASARGDSCGSPEGLWVLRGSIAEGVILPALGIAIFGEGDIFGGFAWGAPARKDKSAVSRFISDLSDLKPGDTVVHIDHGIGLYQGLKQIEVDGEQRDFMLLTYQEDAKLYVPLERLDLVEKYRSGTGEGGPKPALDRLGGASWARTKTRVKRALRDMTAELLRLYAERKMSGGIAFSPDTQWQKEFDDAFEFEETPDQAKALEEIKHDLESPEPMDRLLCGDVGYGKTELAMRAAFKVVQDGKQAAVLAPTTVLSFQHFSTFRRRMAGFPVRVEMISRFRSPAEQKKIIADTEAGRVDILVGTHRLLSKDVAFRDLGLLIVDEEQRFGVAAKEKLKRLRANVDVLTMSATPIPRTLHMSLGGLRDLSVIETPPQGRLAIQTTVAPYTPRLIQAAILNEIERQGQVYFVHNRVEGIFSIAAMIQQLVPKARVGVGHGQMANAELERVMMKFVQGEYDVLVSTSIIENGLDIPRANTIIINRADRFGLAELYQLRGRVGRSDRRAYAFLLIPDEDSLTPIARRRLAALKEFSDLGAGFRLAALDLELRGAGNILGGEQSGHLNAIGLDLYLKMLEETTAELKGQLPKPDVRTTMNLGVDIRIPEQYISDEGQRLRMYKRISGISGAEAGSALEAELADRYGETPQSVRTLLDYALLKNQAEAMLIQSVDRKADEVWIRFHPETPVRPEVLTRFVRRRRDAILRPDGSLRFRFGRGDPSPIPAIRSALQELQGSN
ncbi:MAG: transcription-repair coupling factor [Acidobacteriota bacterium]|nr:transcription-repair coupling factor [Acidobacteriota bacterium]